MTGPKPPYRLMRFSTRCSCFISVDALVRPRLLVTAIDEPIFGKRVFGSVREPEDDLTGLGVGDLHN